MSDAPERIWAWIDYDGNWDGTWLADCKTLHPEMLPHAEYRRADLPPTREQIMADTRVMALVEAGKEWRTARGETEAFSKETWARLANAESAMCAALAALTDNEGETE